MADAENRVPMVVDLDGTIVHTDTLLESALSFLSDNVLGIFTLVYWLLAGGKLRLKSELAHRVDLEVAFLPYNNPSIEWLNHDKAFGNSLVLATASHQLTADKIAAHLGIFDQVLATTDTFNLKGPNKRGELVSLSHRCV